MPKWKIFGEYADGFETVCGGGSEESAMYRLIELIDIHGDLVFYTGVTDEDYCAGEYIGRENFVYS